MQPGKEYPIFRTYEEMKHKVEMLMEKFPNDSNVWALANGLDDLQYAHPTITAHPYWSLNGDEKQQVESSLLALQNQIAKVEAEHTKQKSD